MPLNKLPKNLISLKKSCEDGHSHETLSKICCDKSGNFYILTLTDLYAIEIDKHNMPVFYKVKHEQYKLLDIVTCKGIISKTNGSKLKEKMISEMFDPYVKAPEEELDDDVDNENTIDIDAVKHYKMFPEDKYYEVDNNEVDEESDDIDEHFAFYGECTFIETDFSNSMYDTIIISGKLDSNIVSFKSELIGDKSSYRLVIYTDGTIIVNVVGSEKTICTIKYDDDGMYAEYKTKIHEI